LVEGTRLLVALGVSGKSLLAITKKPKCLAITTADISEQSSKSQNAWQLQLQMIFLNLLKTKMLSNYDCR
jgi:hypothetical protein